MISRQGTELQDLLDDLDDGAPAESLLSRSTAVSYLAMERRFNSGSPSGFHQTVSGRYAPSARESVFRLPLREVPGHWCTIAGTTSVIPGFSNTPPEPPPTIVIPTHPDFDLHLSREWQAVAELEVSPTASGRTVAALENSGTLNWIKLHYPRVLGRNQRDLYLFKWLSSFELSSRLAQIEPCESFDLQLEPFGVFFEPPGERGWGLHVRSYDFASGDVIIPAFSVLYQDKDGAYPVCKMLASIAAPGALESLPATVAGAYWELALVHAVMPECNAQNVLFRVSDTGKISIIFRDLGDFYKDNLQGKHVGQAPYLSRYKTLDHMSDDIVERRSFSFDFKLGNYLLEPLIGALAGSGIGSRTRLIQAVRSVTMQRLDTAPDYFQDSSDWFRYADVASNKRADYVACSNPVFRSVDRHGG